MARLRRRIEWRERGIGGDDDPLAWLDVVTHGRPKGDVEPEVITRDFRDAACREDCDPTLPRQAGVEIPVGPSMEECKQRLAERFERRRPRPT